MSSLNETKVEKICSQSAKGRELMHHNRRHLSRVYPKGQRIDSSNYNPLIFWACNVHMAALNFQTPDKAMQLNQALFALNGHSGYVLQPEQMRVPSYDPFFPSHLNGFTLQIIIYGGRHLPRGSRSISNPFVEVEICEPQENGNKYKTNVVVDNGICPTWQLSTLVFDVIFPDISFLRFTVYEEDMFSDPNFLAHATFTVRNLKTGFRSVPLKNSSNEDLELASLLIHIQITDDKMNGMEDLYSSIQQLRVRTTELSSQVCESVWAPGSHNSYQQQLSELQVTQHQLMELTAMRNQRSVTHNCENGF
uniref:Phosphoinositide phospholipase C n=1 Tax=Eptatretus burgeri TaxID=7764 RepID=A0A8C4NHK7_EPTBU